LSLASFDDSFSTVSGGVWTGQVFGMGKRW
jgi:hypothetical protein